MTAELLQETVAAQLVQLKMVTTALGLQALESLIVVMEREQALNCETMELPVGQPDVNQTAQELSVAIAAQEEHPQLLIHELKCAVMGLQQPVKDVMTEAQLAEMVAALLVLLKVATIVQVLQVRELLIVAMAKEQALKCEMMEIILTVLGV